MKKNINKIKVFIDDLIKVSKIVKVKRKKFVVFKIAIVNNLIVFLDILVILYFTEIFTSVDLDLVFVDQILNQTYFLPVFILLRFYLLYFERVTITSFQYEVEKTLRENLLSRIFENGNFSVADAYFYVNELSRQVGSFFSTFSIFFGSLVQLLIFSTYLLITNFNVVMFFLLGFFFLVIPTFYLTKLGRKYAHITYIQFQKISDDIERLLENMYLIKISKKINYELNSFNQNLKILYSSRIKDIKVGTLNNLLPNFSTLLILSVLLVFFNFSRYLTLDFIAILLRMFQSLGNLNKNLHMVSAYHVYLEKLYNVEELGKKTNSDNYIIDNNLDSAIHLKDVCFKYIDSETKTFEKINLKIPKNMHTLITGPNGSGKSTLLGLISGVLYPSEGKASSFTSKIGYVGSSPLIIKASLRENVLYGNKDSIEDIEITKLLQKLKLFKSLEEYDLNRKISNKILSTGQMQKISFARALIGNKELLILDESTANLDTDSKEIIYKLLKEIKFTIINSTHLDINDISYDNHIEIKLFDNKREILEK